MIKAVQNKVTRQIFSSNKRRAKQARAAQPAEANGIEPRSEIVSEKPLFRHPRFEIVAGSANACSCSGNKRRRKNAKPQPARPPSPPLMRSPVVSSVQSAAATGRRRRVWLADRRSPLTSSTVLKPKPSR